jgi:hypothetical protein
VSPGVKVALEAVATLCLAYDYNGHAIARIAWYIAAHGTATGCPEVDHGDLADIEMCYEESLPAVPYDRESWDREDCFLDTRLMASNEHPFPIPTTGEDDREYPSEADERSYREMLWGYE